MHLVSYRLWQAHLFVWPMLSSCGRVLSFGELGSSDGHAIRCVGIDALLVCSRPSTSHYDGSLRLTHYFVRTINEEVDS